jgi:ribonuclease HI
MFDFIITADGGSINNGSEDSYGYGSFIVERGNSESRSIQFPRTFGAGITNNEAEYKIVAEALIKVKDAIEASGHRAIDHSILIKSDSALVIGQCSQGWKVKALNIRPLWRKLMSLILDFDDVEFEKLSGDKMKSILGH